METQGQSQNIPTPALKSASVVRAQRLPVFKLQIEHAVLHRDTSAVGLYQGPVSDMAAVTSVLKAASALAHCKHSCWDEDQRSLNTESRHIPSKRLAVSQIPPKHLIATELKHQRRNEHWRVTRCSGEYQQKTAHRAITHPNSIDLFSSNGCVLF